MIFITMCDPKSWYDLDVPVKRYIVNDEGESTVANVPEQRGFHC